MYNKQLMNPHTLDIYEKAVEALQAIKKQHKKLIEKAKNKTISNDEKAQLKEIIKVYNKVEKLRKELWDNHSLIKAILK